MQFKFSLPDKSEAGPPEWLQFWSRRYPPKYDEPVYVYLVGKATQMVESDFHILGAWKDGALKKSGLEGGGFDPRNVHFNGKWSTKAEGTAYDTWLRAARDIPGQMVDRYPTDVAVFLTDWSERVGKCGTKTKRFGLSRATTLLHCITGGNYPIFDSRVRRAINKLTGVTPTNSVAWYLDEFCPIFSELAERCEAKHHLRRVDMALFAYGGKD